MSANQVITAVGADGSVDVYSQSGGHLIVDVVGVFTGTGATVSSDGLFVPIEPTRFLDTRPSGRLEPGWSTEVSVAGRLGTTAVSAVAMNVTVLDALFPGYVSATTAGSAATTGSRATSTLNVVRWCRCPNADSISSRRVAVICWPTSPGGSPERRRPHRTVLNRTARRPCPPVARGRRPGRSASPTPSRTPIRCVDCRID